MKFKSLILIFLTINCQLMYGQQDTANNSKNNISKELKPGKAQFIIKTNILAPTLGFTDESKMSTLTTEICFKNKHSIQLNGLIHKHNILRESEFTYEIIPEYKYYIEKKKSYTGFYTGLFLRLRNSLMKYERVKLYSSYYSLLEYKQTSMGAGIIWGYQNYIKKHIVVDFLAGIGGQFIADTKIIKEVNTSFYGYRNNITQDIRFALNLGYKF